MTEGQKKALRIMRGGALPSFIGAALVAAVAVQAQEQGQQQEPATAIATPAPLPQQHFQPLQPNQPPPDMRPMPQPQAIPTYGQYGANAHYQQPQNPQGPVAAPMPRPLPLNMPQQVLDTIAPMTPGEIRQTRNAIEERRQAMVEPIHPQARPMRRAIIADLNPGSVPQVIRASASNGAVVTFIDAGGQSWPIDRVESFNPRDFDVALFGDNGLSIAVKTPYAAAGNFAVRLKDLNTPMTFNIASNQPAVDSAVEVQIPRYVPGNSPSMTGDHTPGIDHQLTDYLLGTPPAGARRLETNNKSVRAWQISDTQMIVVANQLLASPAAFARNSSSSGLHAFRIPLTPSIMLSDLTRVAVSKFSTSGAAARTSKTGAR